MNWKLIEAIKIAKATFPSLRIGQLLLNAVPEGKDLYYISDDDLTELVRKLVNEAK